MVGVQIRGGSDPRGSHLASELRHEAHQRLLTLALPALLAVSGVALAGQSLGSFKRQWVSGYGERITPAGERSPLPDAFRGRLVDTAEAQARRPVRYSTAYVRIPYPGGDVPAGTGACTDIVVRAFRGAGIDLQKRIHEDMSAHFDAYPPIWGLSRPDTNIDHRRVANQMVFFARKGRTLPAGSDPSSYEPGDLVVWELPRGNLHIGIAGRRRSEDGRRPLMIHNLKGTVEEDALFRFRILAHFRYGG